MSVQVKSREPERPILSAAGQARREMATAMHMQQIAEIAASGHPDDQKISYVKIVLYNWRERMKLIDAGDY